MANSRFNKQIKSNCRWNRVARQPENSRILGERNYDGFPRFDRHPMNNDAGFATTDVGNIHRHRIANVEELLKENRQF